ncbi:MAG TPA: hypothetical protein VIM89_19720 [Mucilaginibacter sp.]
MTTFTVQVKDNDAELILKILQKFEAKVTLTSADEGLTQEIATALKEIRDIQIGKSESLSLEHI